MNDVKQHNDGDDAGVLERAAEAMRDEPLPPLSPELVQRTQAAIRALPALRQSPFRHPLLRVAAVVALAICGTAAYLAIQQWSRPAPPTQAGTAPVEPVPTFTTLDAPVAGVVRFAGVAPKPQVLSVAANAHCAAHHRKPVIDESVLVNADGTLRNVVVWVSGGLQGKRFTPPKEPAVLDQQGCVYTPHVVTVMTGQPLLVKNSDPFLHNVRAAAANNPPFNFGQPTVDKGTPLVFLSPERMWVKCDIHPWMNAYVHVIDNPYFAVSDESGAFKLPDLPPGTYTVSAWHEVYGEQSQKVTVQPGRPLSLRFTFKPDERADARASFVQPL